MKKNIKQNVQRTTDHGPWRRAPKCNMQYAIPPPSQGLRHRYSFSARGRRAKQYRLVVLVIRSTWVTLDFSYRKPFFMRIRIKHSSWKMNFLRSFPFFSFAFLFLPLFLFDNGCKNSNNCFSGTSITIPASDATPPTTVMDVHLPNKPIITVTPPSPAVSSTIGGSDTVTIIAKGTDPEGTKDIQIWVEETWWTTSGGTTTQTGPGLLGAPEAHNLDNGTAGAKGCTERVATLNLYIKQRRKLATSYRIRTWATAINFGGAKVNSAVVTLTWP